MTVTPTKGKLPLEAKISVNQRWICNKRSLETIEASSIINTFTSDNPFLNMVLILSLNGGTCFLKHPTGIFRPVCIVVPPIFIAATPVGARSSTFAFSNSEFLYENVLDND